MKPRVLCSDRLAMCCVLVGWRCVVWLRWSHRDAAALKRLLPEAHSHLGLVNLGPLGARRHLQRTRARMIDVDIRRSEKARRKRRKMLTVVLKYLSIAQLQ